MWAGSILAYWVRDWIDLSAHDDLTVLLHQATTVQCQCSVLLTKLALWSQHQHNQPTHAQDFLLSRCSHTLWLWLLITINKQIGTARPSLFQGGRDNVAWGDEHSPLIIHVRWRQAPLHTSNVNYRLHCVSSFKIRTITILYWCNGKYAAKKYSTVNLFCVLIRSFNIYCTLDHFYECKINTSNFCDANKQHYSYHGSIQLDPPTTQNLLHE
jgi:hypothetical protein